MLACIGPVCVPYAYWGPALFFWVLCYVAVIIDYDLWLLIPLPVDLTDVTSILMEPTDTVTDLSSNC